MPQARPRRLTSRTRDQGGNAAPPLPPPRPRKHTRTSPLLANTHTHTEAQGEGAAGQLAAEENRGLREELGRARAEAALRIQVCVRACVCVCGRARSRIVGMGMFACLGPVRDCEKTGLLTAPHAHAHAHARITHVMGRDSDRPE